MATRSDWLGLDESALLRQCAVDTYRASGPGGQKRNKTSSAVRLRHGPSGLIVIAEESRSQHENKARALRRLRAELALHVREPFDPDVHRELFARCRDGDGRLSVGRRQPDFWPLMAALLDALESAGGEVRRAADLLGWTTAPLSAALTDDDKVMAEANAIRRRHGHKPLVRR